MGGHVCVCVCLSMPHTCCTCIAFAKYVCRQQQKQLPAVRIRHAQRATATVTADSDGNGDADSDANCGNCTISAQPFYNPRSLSHAFCLILHCSFNIASVAVAARSRRFIAIMLQLARNALACLRERERERGREACVRVHCLHFKLNSFKFQFLPL